jgi:hypothetical protein
MRVLLRALSSVFVQALLLAPLSTSIAAAADSAVRLIRSTSGTKGSVQGSRFVIADPRTTFQAGQDRQVIVYFEWEGAVGAHECKATWKDPSGASVLIAPYPYQAKSPRFGVYWTLALPESPRLGLWAVEAEVDGMAAGIHTFQIQEGAGPSGGGPGRRVLSPADLYARAHAATLAVESFDGKGGRLSTGSGFLLGEGAVVTAFQVIEGASRLRLVPSTGEPVETTEVAAWNRRQDWAVLRTPASFGPVQLELDRSRSWKVGDRCALIDTTAEGARVMSETTIVGAQDFPQAGPRISIQAPVSVRSLGGPLLNEYGEAIAVLGGTLTPGISSVRSPAGVSLLEFASTAMAFPVSSLPAVAAEARATLQDLAARGVFTPPLVSPLNVLTGTIARGVEKRNNIPMPLGEKSEFRRTEGEAFAFLTFDPQEKRDGAAVFRIYDIDNRLVLRGPPQKLALRPRVYSVVTWNFPLARLAAGTYRIDLDIDEQPAWRTYFRVVE